MPYDDRDDDDLDDLDISIGRNRRGVNIPNYLILSILTTLFCCWILGIPAIVYAAKVNTLVAQGDYEGARAASNTARAWCIANMVLCLIGMFLYCAAIIATDRRGF